MGLIINNVIDNNIIAMDWIDRLKVMPKERNTYRISHLDITPESYYNSSFFRNMEFYNKLPRDSSIQKITFPKLLENLYASFKPDNPLHMDFKLLCDSLDDSRTSKLIKNTILDECINNDASIDILYGYVKTKIAMFYDFTLICPNNKKILCLKSILQTIPYFKMMIEDTQVDNTMTIDVKYELMDIIINIINGRIYNEVGYDTYIDIFELMDKYLMIYYFPVMVEHGIKHMQNYVNDLIKINAYDKIKILYQIFRNVLESTMENFEFAFRGQFWSPMKLKSDIRHLMTIICNSDMANNIITFEGWEQYFPLNQKLKYVASSKNYELLQTINVDPVLIIAFMSHIDFSNNIYYDILNSDVEVIFGPEKYELIKKSTIIVHNYYPILSYTKIIEIPIHIFSGGDCVSVKFHNNNMMVPVGAKISWGDTFHTITKITKYNAKNSVDVNVAQYISSRICDDIYYGLYFDKKIINLIELFGNKMFLVENVKHDIKI